MVRARLLTFAVVAVAVQLIGTRVEAATVFSDRASFDLAFPTSVVEDWDSFATGTVFPDGSGSAGITYISSSGNALVTSSYLTTTAPNGLGDDVEGYFTELDTITFVFASPRSAFGIDINTFASVDGTYLATTDTGEVISSFFDPFPAERTGQFLGFSGMTPFLSVTISVAAGTDAYTLDTLRHVPAAVSVPEPASLSLLGIGFLCAGAGRIRRHRQQVI